MNSKRFHPRLSLCAVVICAMATMTRGADWPQAAGPNASFVVEGKAPASFSVTHDRNVVWKSPLPSTGQGTPIISDGRVFVTSHEPIAQDTQYGAHILGICYDAATGKELWRRSLPGVRNTDLSSLFSDNTAASPVASGKRVCFVNVGGSIKCFDFSGKEQWSYKWVPFGRHHARLHEPILFRGQVITVQYPGQDLKPIHTTKPGAKPLGRDKKYWTHLQAFDLESGKRNWVASTGTSIHHTSSLSRLPDGRAAILTGRGGGHQPPEEPYGLSLVDAENGKTIWELGVKGFPSAQNSAWHGRRAYAFTGSEHLTVDTGTGRVLHRVSLVNEVTVVNREGQRESTERLQLARRGKSIITKNTNLLVGNYHYFRTASGFYIGRVNVTTNKVEYLQVPVQVVRRAGEKDRRLWDKALPNDMKNAKGFVASQDRRNAGNGWGHVSAASPIVVGDKLYVPTMIGMVYVLNWNAERLDANALVSISDLGPATETWSLSSLSYSNDRLFARTLKELICIGK